MEESNQTKSVFTISGRHRFVACVILVILVSCATFAYLSYCYKQAQNDIVALQRKDALVFEQVLNSSKNVKSKSSENIDQLQALLDKHQERQEALLHLEYNKLQADFNVLMFAASCLMIIFLVFSLYSIFKTDEIPVHPLAPQTDEVHTDIMGEERDDS